jgi:AraC-like DNA-binding protein
MIVESEIGMENILIPDTSIIIAFRLKGIVLDKAQQGDPRLPNLVFSGLRKQPRIINYAQNSATLLVNFKEGGASVFFNIPLHHFFGQNIALEHFLPPTELAAISERLQEATTDSMRILLVEEFLKARMNHSKVDPLIANAVQKIKEVKGDIKISHLLKELYISKDPFEKKFRQAVGTTPKQFANIIRLRNSITNYTENKSLSEIALETGYYDQSHFIHEFKLFTGQTPLHFFRKPDL